MINVNIPPVNLFGHTARKQPLNLDRNVLNKYNLSDTLDVMWIDMRIITRCVYFLYLGHTQSSVILFGQKIHPKAQQPK